MSTRLIVDHQKQLQELPETGLSDQPTVIRLVAKIISYIFHPVFVPVYLIWFLLYIHPNFFVGYSWKNKILILAQAFMMLTFFPLISVLLLKALKFINSIYLHTQKDRIIPFIACMTWYFWLWYVWNNMGKANDGADMPQEIVKFALAIFITTIIGLMVNIRIKVSLHSISMGVMVTFIILLGLSQPLHFGIYISLAILITGLVCTSRLLASDHTQQEVYSGLIVGVVSMLIANWLG